MSVHKEQPARTLLHRWWLLALALAGTAIWQLNVENPDTKPTAQEGHSRRSREKEAQPLLQPDQRTVEALPSSRLRALLEEAKRKTAKDPQWRPLQSPGSLAKALGRRDGRAGADWIESQISPDLLSDYIAGWTEVDPAAALDFIAISTQPKPCDISDVSKMLAHACEEGPEALSAAVRKVPWHSFEPFEPNPEIAGRTTQGSVIFILDASDQWQFEEDSPDQNSSIRSAYKTWIDSGAARYLEENGVPINGFFGQYTKLDPDRVFSDWAAWNLPDRLSACSLFGCLEALKLDKPAVADKLRELHANPVTSAKTLRMISWAKSNNADFLNELVPELTALATPLETPPKTGEAPAAEEK